MRVTAVKLVVLAALAAAAACGGGDSPSAPAPIGSGPITITIVGERGQQSFSPNPAMAAGQVVVFRNSDSEVHRVRLNDLSIDTGDIPPGGTSKAVTMPPAGANYHCFLHPTTMLGSVAASNTAPPPCTGIYC